MKRILVLILVFLFFGWLAFFYFRRISPPAKDVTLDKLNNLTISPYPTWIPKTGAKMPEITYQKFPFKTTDKTRKVELIGCIPDNSEWGLAYPKKEVFVPNVSAIATETMNAFLAEAANSGWGGFPTRDEILKYFGRPQEVILLKLTIDRYGLARVYLSGEAKAYGGGSSRVACMQDSTELTLKQFPEIKEVVLCLGEVCADQKGAEIFQP